MSQENVEIVRRALATESIEPLIDHLSPEIEWTTTGAFLEAATYHGHDEVRRYLGAMQDEFDDLRSEPQELIDAGEEVVVGWRIKGVGKRSGASVDLMLYTVGLVREGRNRAAPQLHD